MAEKNTAELTPEDEFDAAFEEEEVKSPEETNEDTQPEPEFESVPEGEVDEEQEPEVEQEKSGEESADTPNKEAEQNDLWDGITAEQKEYLAAIEREKQQLQQDRDSWAHKYNSDKGRFNAAFQKMQEMQKTAAKGDTPKPTQEQVTKALQDTDEFKKFKEEWGEHADMLTFVGDHLRETIRDEIKQEFQPTFEELERDKQHREHQMREAAQFQAAQELDAARPGWRDDVQSPDFLSWAEHQPPFKQQIIRFSSDARDLASVLEDYELHKQVATWRQQQNEANKTSLEREKRLERATTTPSKAGAAGKINAQPTGFDEVFESIT